MHSDRLCRSECIHLRRMAESRERALMLSRLRSLADYSAILFLLSYAFVVVPGSSVTDVMYVPRLIVLGSFLVLWILAKLVSDTETRLADILRLPRHLAKHEWFLLLYATLIVISSVLSPLPGYAFFGHPFTLTGSLFQLGMIALYFIFSRLVSRHLALWALAIVTILSTLITVAEALGARPSSYLFQGVTLTIYQRGALGSDALTAGFFVLLGSTGLAVLRHEPKVSRPVAFAWVVSATVGVALNPGKAGWLAGAVCLVLFVALAHRGSRWANLRVLIALLAVFIAAPMVAEQGARLIGTGGSPSTESSSLNTLHTRLILWKAGLRMFLERPVIGWGDDNYSLNAFDYLTRAEAGELCTRELHVNVPEGGHVETFGNVCIVADEHGEPIVFWTLEYAWPHNVIVQEAVSHGALGLLTLVASVVFFLIRVLRDNRQALWSLPLLSYGVFLVAFFYVIPITPFFWIILGLATNLRPPTARRPDATDPSSSSGLARRGRATLA